MQGVVLAAGGLVVLILGAGAMCWAAAALKYISASRRLPEGFAGLAWSILTSLQIRPGLPLVLWNSRRPVPWALVDLVCMFGLYFVGILAVRLVFDALGWMPDVVDEEKLPLADKGMLIWANIGISLAIIAVGLPLLALRTGGSWFDFGLSSRGLWSNVRLGLIGFVMLAPPVYAIQGLLVKFWQPSKHPMMEMFKTSPDAGFFVVLVIAAAVVAPIFEELIFRVLLQGFLEKVFSFRGQPQDFVLEMLFGWRPSPAPLPAPAVPLLPPTSAEGESGITYIAAAANPDYNPYTPAPIVAEGREPIVLADFADGGNQPELRGVAAWAPIVISSAIFALLHYSHGPDWVALTLLAAGMGYLYQRTHSVIPSLVVHALLNGLSMLGLWIQVYVAPDLGGM
jgi:membrane protease YdiL (CAAX protease family)